MALNLMTNQTDWNKFVLENGGGFLQSWEWGDFQEAVGRNAFRYRVDSSENDEPKETVGQFLLVQHRLPLGQSYIYIPKGPVVVGEGYHLEPFKACSVAIAAAARRLGAAFARIEPPATSTDLDTGRMREFGFVPAAQVQPQHTAVIDLTKDEAALLAAMKQKTRYNIRIAEKHGVSVRIADSADAPAFAKDVEAFWKLMSETAERDRFRAHGRAYYEKMLDILSPNKGRALKIRLVFAEYAGEPVAAAIIGHCGDTATYLHGASTSRHKETMAPYFLHWTAIREAKAVGLKRYDFWGVAPEGADEKHPWHGITRFKLGFGGDRISYVGTWDLPQNRLKYGLYRLVRSLGRWA